MCIRDRHNTDLVNLGFKCVSGATQPRTMPRVIVYDVDRELDMVTSVWHKNEGITAGYSEDDFGAEFIPQFQPGRARDGVGPWVVSVSPKLYERLTLAGRIYAGLRACRVREYEAVTRCFKCQGLGHIGKVCRNMVTCGKCGEEGHHAVACPESDSGIRCALCKIRV